MLRAEHTTRSPATNHYGHYGALQNYRGSRKVMMAGELTTFSSLNAIQNLSNNGTEARQIIQSSKLSSRCCGVEIWKGVPAHVSWSVVNSLCVATKCNVIINREKELIVWCKIQAVPNTINQMYHMYNCYQMHSLDPGV
ncbi:hypothetical protein TNCV_4427961 [Trichonephila clavipes]|nr:hypothetical protein TNCV_4427961 [Trichonephila clavipes]